jgi:hypothetical protein
MKQLFSLLIIICCVIVNKNSDLKAQVFDKTIAAQDYTDNAFLTPINDSGFLVVSGLFNMSLDATGFYLLKSDAAGQIKWKKKYNVCSGIGCSGDWIYPSAIHQLSDGNYICMGSYYHWIGSSGAIDYEYLYVFKTDTAGNILWLKRTNTAMYDGYRSFSVLEIGDDLIIGFVSTIFGQGSRPAVMKIKSGTGNLIWTKNYTSITSAYSLVCTVLKKAPDNNLILLTPINRGDSSGENFCLIKLDTSGSLIWTKMVATSATDIPLDFEMTSDSGFIITGSMQSASDTGVLLLKADSGGNVLWAKIFKDTFMAAGQVVHQTSDKGYIIGGGLAGFAILRIGAFLMKTDSIGTPLWTRRFTNRGGISSVSQTPDGGFVFSGRAVEPEGKGFYFTRADASGGSCNASILSQSLEDTLIVSESALPGLMADSLPLSLSSVTFAQIDTGGAITGCGGLKVAPIAEKEGYDIKIYPNPSTGKFEINIISEKYIGAVTIKVTNIIGTVVMTEEVKDGDRAFRKDIDLSALQKGIYFVVVADHEMQTARKVIVN